MGFERRLVDWLSLVPRLSLTRLSPAPLSHTHSFVSPRHFRQLEDRPLLCLLLPPNPVRHPAGSHQSSRRASRRPLNLFCLLCPSLLRVACLCLCFCLQGRVVGLRKHDSLCKRNPSIGAIKSYICPYHQQDLISVSFICVWQISAACLCIDRRASLVGKSRSHTITASLTKGRH
jgi:hypothetical protein